LLHLKVKRGIRAKRSSTVKGKVKRKGKHRTSGIEAATKGRNPREERDKLLTELESVLTATGEEMEGRRTVKGT